LELEILSPLQSRHCFFGKIDQCDAVDYIREKITRGKFLFVSAVKRYGQDRVVKVNKPHSARSSFDQPRTLLP
jgi:hypothetical protein